MYENTCTNCGKIFFVETKAKADPNNKRKFKRACSEECTRQLKSKNLKRLNAEGKITHKSGHIIRKLDRDVLIDLYCRQHLLMSDIQKILHVKADVLRREFDRLEVPKEFYRNCPQCGCEYACKNRCMVDPSSNKFKKFCSRKCFLSSRNQTDTWIEREIQSFLQDEDIDFVKQFEIDRMTVDFLIPSKNIIIEANGDFWHANPAIYGKKKPLHKIHPRVIEKDDRKLKQLSDKGYLVYVVWENDLKNDASRTLDALLVHIKQAG
jgi:G:T-mismatch repair DNA endonuclease (very short patch repair protein)